MNWLFPVCVVLFTLLAHLKALWCQLAVAFKLLILNIRLFDFPVQMLSM